MKYLEQKPGHYWWTKNPRYFAYMIREINGIILGLLALVTILAYALLSSLQFFGIYNIRPELFFRIVLFIGFAASLIHTFTWLFAMSKILPFNLSALQQKIAFVIILIFWFILSSLLFRTFYSPSIYG